LGGSGLVEAGDAGLPVETTNLDTLYVINVVCAKALFGTRVPIWCDALGGPGSAAGTMPSPRSAPFALGRRRRDECVQGSQVASLLRFLWYRGAMTRVSRLRWTPNNTAHVLRHDVRTNEVEEVIRGDDESERGHSGRIVLIGPTSADRMLAVIVEPEGSGTFLVVTARPASRKERRRYLQKRGEIA
jgi:uncharacterized DUF497 family protein